MHSNKMQPEVKDWHVAVKQVGSSKLEYPSRAQLHGLGKEIDTANVNGDGVNRDTPRTGVDSSVM